MASFLGSRLCLDLESAGELAGGLTDIRAEYPERFTDAGGVPVSFVRRDAGTGMRVGPAGQRAGEEARSDGALIEYGRAADALRGLGVLMGGLLQDGSIPVRHESSRFATTTVMVDVSRNAVLKPAAAASLIRRLALMGITGLMLYTEDTYEVPDEPYFGHARGRYTADELRQIDDAAYRLGMEVVPCIQTLGHMENVLKWSAYRPVRDNAEVLLADDPDTYELIRKMIRAASGPVRSTKIHIGMDETWGLGGGVHRNRHGAQPPFEIFNRHLGRVVEICSELGLEPMMWSDMYFRLASPNNSQHDLDCAVPPEVARQIPAGVKLVYWDYDHVDASHYARQIERHRDLGREPVYAGGALTWLHLWAQNPASFAALEAGMAAARAKELDEVMVTLWGDDGNECDHFSALPAIQGFADAAYTGRLRSPDLAANFRGSCDATLDSWLRASDVDMTDPGWEPAASPEGVLHPGNPGKWILWADPVLDLADLALVGATSRHYGELSSQLEELVAAGAAGDRRLSFVVELARVLTAKCDLHARLRPAYTSKDVDTVRELVDSVIPAVERGVDRLRKAHRDRWHEVNKTFGWEVIERRYGGLSARLDTLREVLAGWLEDPSHPIEALEVEQLPLFRTGRLARSLRHDAVATACLPN